VIRFRSSGSRRLRLPGRSEAARFRRQIRARHPGFREAVAADAVITATYRGERSEFRSGFDTVIQVIRLMLASDAFFAQVAYRAKARMQALRIPVLPRIAHYVAMMTAQVSIGDPVIVQPGVYIVHGQVVIDGITEIQSGVVLFPWITIGLTGGELMGPTIGQRAQIATGARVLGNVHVGADARVGANAVVLEDVPAGATAVGTQARIAEAGAETA
jgi:serine O-acetyltransferase